MRSTVELSVIVPVTERYDDVAELYAKYIRGVRATGLTFEFIYVLDGDYPQVLQVLKDLRENGENIKIITLAKWFGEAVALNLGFEHSCGEIVLTLPAAACQTP